MAPEILNIIDATAILAVQPSSSGRGAGSQISEFNVEPEGISIGPQRE
jgi:hypothetical protein